MSWFSQGFGGVKKEEKRRAQAANRVSRWWMPKPEPNKPSEAEIIFLDDEPFCFYEHNPKLTREINGQMKTGWKDNWFTCVEGVFKDDPGCAMCRNGIGKYYVGLLTILDCSEFEWEGKIYKNTRKLFAAKFKTLKYLKAKKRRMDGLAGKRFLVSRSDGDAPSVGNDFEFIREEEMIKDEKTGLYVLADKQYWWKDKKEQQEHPPMPFDYQKVAAPLSNEDLQTILAGGTPDSDPASFNFGENAKDGEAQGEQGSGQSSPDSEASPY